MQTKFNAVIAGANGERIVTSTTEQLRIPASEIRPGGWLLKPHRRGLAKDKLVTYTKDTGGQYVVIGRQLYSSQTMHKDAMVDVERTT